MIADRQLPSGGWNVGNTIVFDTELEATADGTGPGLAAMAGWSPKSDITHSIAFARAEWPAISTPFSLGWLLAGLTPWGERPADADAKVATALEDVNQFGGYTTEQLAILAIGFTGGFE